MKLRKKPVIIEGVQWTGDNLSEIQKFYKEDCVLAGGGNEILIETLEGTMAARRGDWILKGVNGEFYPCKPGIKELTYDNVEEDVAPRYPWHETESDFRGGDKQRGLYNKFTVTRIDGTSEPYKKHYNCRYFVLDLTHDKHAIPAIDAYQKSCGKEYRQLAEDLRAWLKRREK